MEENFSRIFVRFPSFLAVDIDIDGIQGSTMLSTSKRNQPYPAEFALNVKRFMSSNLHAGPIPGCLSATISSRLYSGRYCQQLCQRRGFLNQVR